MCTHTLSLKVDSTWNNQVTCKGNIGYIFSHMRQVSNAMFVTCVMVDILEASASLNISNENTTFVGHLDIQDFGEFNFSH